MAMLMEGARSATTLLERPGWTETVGDQCVLPGVPACCRTGLYRLYHDIDEDRVDVISLMAGLEDAGGRPSTCCSFDV